MLIVAVVCTVLIWFAFVGAHVELTDAEPGRDRVALVAGVTFGIPFYAEGAAALDVAGGLLTAAMILAVAGAALSRQGGLRS